MVGGLRGGHELFFLHYYRFGTIFVQCIITITIKFKNMKITNETKEFCKYLVDAKLVVSSLLKNEAALCEIQKIIENVEDARKANSKSVQFFLTEYDEWCELYKQ